MYELTRTEIDALLVRFDDLIRQAKAIQEQLQRALARSSELANRRPTGQPQDRAQDPEASPSLSCVRKARTVVAGREGELGGRLLPMRYVSPSLVASQG